MSGGELAFDAGIVWLIGALFFVLALLYSSVGHAGASGYLAVMALFEISQELMRPVALSLNILVASLTVFRFHKAGYLKGKDIWPLVIASVPSAFIGGSMTLPMDIYRPALGGLLLASAAYLLWSAFTDPETFAKDKAHLPRVPALGLGGSIGLASGLTGIGGGVLLSPTILILRWTNVRRTSAIAASFILFNSSAGLAGNVIASGRFPTVIPIWAAAAMLGGFIGSKMGSQVLAPKVLIWLLSAALVIAGGKFLFA